MLKLLFSFLFLFLFLNSNAATLPAPVVTNPLVDTFSKTHSLHTIPAAKAFKSSHLNQSKLFKLLSKAVKNTKVDKDRSTLGIVSMLCGILGLGLLFAGAGLFSVLFPIGAIVLGFVSLKKSRHKVFSILGLVFGFGYFAILIFLALLWVAFFSSI